MRAAQLISPGEFVVHDVPDPRPTAGQVLLRVEGAGMCGSDLHLVHGGSVSALPLPITLGHETTATVLDPNGAPGIAEGQRVLVGGIWGCMTCRPCRLGRVNACEMWALIAPIPAGPGLGFDGGMAEYMVAPAHALADLGDLDPLTAAPLADAAITPAHAVSLVRNSLGPDATVLVIGVGGLGHIGLQVLRATTGARIIATDIDPARVNAAPAYGADVALLSGQETAAEVLELTGGLGADVVIDFVGNDATLLTAIGTVRTYGSIVAVGLGEGTMPFTAGGRARIDGPPWGVNVVRPYGATISDVYDVLALAHDGRVKAEVEVFDLDNAAAVLDSLRRGEISGRAVLRP
jgi:propanol-preferring alcohol dehydrogenase